MLINSIKNMVLISSLIRLIVHVYYRLGIESLTFVVSRKKWYGFTHMKEEQINVWTYSPWLDRSCSWPYV